MNEKICRHCGASLLVGLDYCPACLHPARDLPPTVDSVPKATVAPGADGTRWERFQDRWHEVIGWFDPRTANATDPDAGPSDQTSTGTATISEAYTRIVCPKCQRANRAPADQAPSDRVLCRHCLHQFPAASASEFRRGADLNCYRCGVTIFCISGIKISQCPNCKNKVVRHRDPEKHRLFVMVTVVASAVTAGLLHAIATQTTSQFFLWLCIATVFTFFGFITMVALGF